MSTILTPSLSKETKIVLRKEQLERYDKQGFTRENYELEIVAGCKLPWVYYKPKTFCLSCYREETGIKPDPKNGNTHSELKPLVFVNRQIVVVNSEENKGEKQSQRRKTRK